MLDTSTFFSVHHLSARLARSSTTMSNNTTLHVRAETKALEHRSAITPTIAKKLVAAGYTVNVERSPLSIFQDGEYEGTGATLVKTGSWTDAPQDHIIVGLKELPEEDFPLKHTVSCSLRLKETTDKATACSICSLYVYLHAQACYKLRTDGAQAIKGKVVGTKC